MLIEHASQVHRVGAATVTRVDETSFALAPDQLFPAWNPGDGRALEERFTTDSLDLTNRRVPLKTHLWVVELDGLTIVVDTGIGNGKSRPFSALFDRLDNPVLERLHAAGFQPEQVDLVLLTHLHVDHVGWNTHWQDGRWAPVFPNATYVFGERERDYFATPESEARRMVFEDSVLPIIKAGQARAVPDAGEEILDGIRFLPTFGHSTGHMAIEIRSRGETALFSGDVMHSALQVHRPEWNSVFCSDHERARESRHGLLTYAAETGATVFAAHFAETSAGTVTRVGSGFEWSYARAHRSGGT
ncbi:MBL fold metallo-hydrolase [Paraburkholderia diazotrophica]|uniref:Glyoxylase, beta-lactamase superfamily II n=1 Tax=Paraburkholderia diazotrophica TaxID=667676 RepID=A0A1H7EIX4_9BURK|nr:MBL fold metallo-hydrolase [Paraburkholderia diazotrophica]SEK11982.1 Glyoxylase, beta-lactamase superfamily II [Paraburkholderia diazotrophica]